MKRLKPGDIAVIDHADIDRVAADDLVGLGIRCVLNAASSSSGRYPNPGPMILTDAGVHLVDLPGVDLFELLDDGQEIVVRGGDVVCDGRVIASGDVKGFGLRRGHDDWLRAEPGNGGVVAHHLRTGACGRNSAL